MGEVGLGLGGGLKTVSGAKKRAPPSASLPHTPYLTLGVIARRRGRRVGGIGIQHLACGREEGKQKGNAELFFVEPPQKRP